ncbi:MAG: hypothetical protein IJG57_05755 [Firmicutes bacterium]|nr:hypothetical protein [Bacillota bacterium]
MNERKQGVRLQIVKAAEKPMKERKPLYARVWFWGIVIAVVLGIGWNSAGAGPASGSGDTPEPPAIVTEVPADLPQSAVPLTDAGVWA